MPERARACVHMCCDMFDLCLRACITLALVRVCPSWVIYQRGMLILLTHVLI